MLLTGVRQPPPSNHWPPNCALEAKVPKEEPILGNTLGPQSTAPMSTGPPKLENARLPQFTISDA